MKNTLFNMRHKIKKKLLTVNEILQIGYNNK
jgi:hypothetical protein